MAKVQRDAEVKERELLWAAMRQRLNKADEEAARSGKTSRYDDDDGASTGHRKLIVLTVAAAVLLLIGGGAAYVFAARESRLTAAEAWEEFSRDKAVATEKYKGKFVQITGKVVSRPAKNNTEQLMMETGPDAKGHIEFKLKEAEMKGLKSGQEVTLRGRFSPRKEPDADLLLSNCTLVKVN